MSHPSWELPSRNDKQRTSLSSATPLKIHWGRYIYLHAACRQACCCHAWCRRRQRSLPDWWSRHREGSLIIRNIQMTGSIRYANQGMICLKIFTPQPTWLCAILSKCMSSLMVNNGESSWHCFYYVEQCWFNVGPVCVSDCNATAADP